MKYNNITSYEQMKNRRSSISKMNYDNGYYCALEGLTFDELGTKAGNIHFLKGYKDGILEYNDQVKQNDDYMSEIQSIAIKVREY